MAVLSSAAVRTMIQASGRPDVDELIAQAGVDPRSTELIRVDAEPFYGVIEKIVDEGQRSLPYDYGRSVPIDSLGIFGLVIKTAPTIRVALERCERYIALLGDAVRYELRPHGRGVAFIVAGRPAHRPGVAVANEGAIAALLSLCRQAAAPSSRLVPLSVSFAHPDPGPSAARREFFGCPVLYDAPCDALHLDAAFLATPTLLGDEGLSDYLVDRLDGELRSTAEDQSVRERVHHVVANGLADGVPPMRVVAGRLAMSERTLHRRLADESLRYQDVVVEVRRNVALKLLTTTEHSLLDIAFLTGFSDQSAFQRAFKRWTGQTPLEARRG